MTNIVERLRRVCNYAIYSDGAIEPTGQANYDCQEAASEIERLNALVDYLIKEAESFEEHERAWTDKDERRDAEIERLQRELRLHWDIVDRRNAEIARLRTAIAAERERCAKIVLTLTDPSTESVTDVRRLLAAAIRKGE